MVGSLYGVWREVNQINGSEEGSQMTVSEWDGFLLLPNEVSVDSLSLEETWGDWVGFSFLINLIWSYCVWIDSCSNVLYTKYCYFRNLKKNKIFRYSTFKYIETPVSLHISLVHLNEQWIEQCFYYVGVKDSF